MSSKIAKTIARQKEKIAEGQFYEAHQQLRVITARYLKAEDYTSAADILSNGSLLLLRAGQGGSGGDLAMMLVNDVYVKGEYAVTDDNRKRLIEILRAFPPGDPIRKRFVQEAINWSSKYGDIERGDPELHHAIGALYAEESEAYDAERHLLLGTSASPPILSTLHFNWYKADSPHTVAIYASRSILPYLVLGNLQSANLAFSSFANLLTNTVSLPMQQIDSSKSSARIFQSIPLLNFLAHLLLACQKADASLFRHLTKYYTPHLKEVDEYWSDALTQIGEIWFGIKIPRQSGGNPLFDMMGSMLFGGNQSGGQGTSGAGKSGTKPKPLTGAPVAMDLD